jgi:hypothetical protein
MKRAFLVSSMLAVLLSTPLVAKGVTKRITVRDLATGTTIEFTDVQRFNVWAGLGTSSSFNGGPPMEGGEGFIVDWSTGAVDQRPQGLRRYEVRFYVLRARATTESLAYVVGYEYDPASQRGFVYLPGRADDHYHLNVGSVHRGVEGQWFNASRAWQQTVGPAIAAR